MILLALLLPSTSRAECAADVTIRDELDCYTSLEDEISDGDSGVGGLCSAGYTDCYSCGEPEAALDQLGAEHVYSFTCGADGEITLSLTEAGCDLDLYVLDDTCDPYGGCLEGATAEEVADASLVFDCVEGELRYVVVEGYGFTRSGAYEGNCDDSPASYTLSVDVAASGACVELCDNGVEDDGDGALDCEDDDCLGAPACCDGDGDGYLADSADCGGDDCDDGDAAAHPDAAEIWYDGVDQDCDGGDDDDADGDGYPLDGDCDDGDAASYPGADELCDEVDNDCDEAVDEGAGGAAEWYYDGDGDGFGDPAVTASGCEAPEGYVAEAGDCDDASADVGPGAAETCDGGDEDCDGAVDEEAVDEVLWYRDADEDGFGDLSDAAWACAAPEGYVDNSEDCDDADGDAFPGKVEVCDRADNDCDGQVDVGAADARSWYYDGDEDGFGDPETEQLVCEAPEGYVAFYTDCDDSDPAVYPEAEDDWYDGVDADCAGDNDYDADGDAYVALGYEDEVGGTAPEGGDCDDADPDLHPGAFDAWYDGVDADCAGDDDYDADGDGYPAEGYGAGEVEDCDDEDPLIYPGAPGYGEDCLPVDTAPADTGDTGGLGDTDPPPVDSDPPAAEDTGQPEAPKRCSSLPGAAPGPAGLLLLAAALRRRRRA